MNFAEYLSQHKCERPDLRLIEENEQFRDLICLTCHLHWRVTRSKLKAAAREENRLDAIRKLNDAERERVAVSGRYYQGVKAGGVRHGG